MNTNVPLNLDFLISIIENIDEPVFVKNANHVWVLHNNQFGELIGRDKDDIVGKSDFDFFSFREASVFWEKDNEVFKSGKKSINFEFITNNQNITHFIRTKKSLFFDPEGSKYLVGVITNIIEKDKIEEEFIKTKEHDAVAIKAKNRFLSNMSHEIRTPLYSIIGFTELLLREEKNAHKQELLSAIGSSGSVLLNTINDVLDIANIEEGKTSVSNDNFDLKKLIQEVTSGFETLIKTNGNTLNLEVDERITNHFYGDSLKIKQILNNLLSNANKFTENGLITLSARIDECSVNNNHVQCIAFSIADTGVGIKKNYIPNIFDYFSQQDSSKTKVYAGTGLGLYTVKAYVDLLEGSISVDSEEGKGSTFEVTLPLSVTSSTDRHTRIAPIDFGDLGDMSILIAEDNPLNQLLIKKILDKENFKLHIVNNGLEAYEVALKEHFDIILMDIQMPVMDGYEACKEIRTIPGYENIPIIALTANVVTEDINEVRKAGMHYMSKPFDLTQFFDKLRELSQNK